MKLIVAVSGGVDSVVLLDMLVQERQHELIVAHFDHGIRSYSAEDALFVAEITRRYGLPFEMKREELGANASEELARARRYAFLRGVAKKYEAVIATAHHMDDIAETIAINLTRGTGWRGLAVLAGDVYRPLLGTTKAELRAYAQEHEISWHEDSTNTSDAYLRNRLRVKLDDEDRTLQLAALRAEQVRLRNEVSRELETLGLKAPYSRHFFSMIDGLVASECLRHITRGALTRPQRDRALLAIKTQRAGSIYEAGSGISLHFTSRHFTLTHATLV